jgi:hypothetical protein
MRFAAALLLALLALPALADPPDAATVDGWIRDLGDDDAGKRDAAEKRLAETGDPVLGKLKVFLAKGEAGPEALARMQRLVEGMEHAKWWEKTWTEKPLDLALDYVKDRRCGTCRQNRVPYKVVALEHAALAKRFPDLRFFVLDWDCCEDKPIATVVLAVGRAVDVRIEISGIADWPTKIAPYVPAVKSAEEAREAGSLLVSLSEQPIHYDEKVIVDPSRGEVDGAEGCFTVSIPYGGQKSGMHTIVNFDKDGKLTGIGVVEK